MTDREMWNNAVAVVREEYESLAEPLRERLRVLIGAIRREKTEICSVPGLKGAHSACAECGGGCCRTGKYHFTVIDLLAFFDAGKPLFSPSFGGTSCPYLGSGGCLMEPSFRPLTCVIFLCDRLETLLTAAELTHVEGVERSLRNHYRTIEDLVGNRPARGLLLGYGCRVQEKSADVPARGF